MTTKQIKQWLVLAIAGLVIAALGLVAWGLLAPVNVTGWAGALASGSDRGATGSVEEASGQPTLQQLQSLSRIDLRRPLKDPPPPPPPKPVPLRAALLGTIVEPENPQQSMAMFRLSDGSERWVSPGQTFDDPVGAVKLIAVGDRSATLYYRGQESKLEVSGR